MNDVIKIGIIGGGFVGTATKQLKCKDVDVRAYDIDQSKCDPVGTTIDDIINSDIIMICVPTPSGDNGLCDTTIVEDVVSQINKISIKRWDPIENQYFSTPPICIRSTVRPSWVRSHLNLSYFPEFLTESNYLQDFRDTSNWIFGSTDVNCVSILQRILTIAKSNGVIKNDSMVLMSPVESSVTKYARNCFLATKVGFCNEIYRFCNKYDIDYENVRKGFVLDDRIGESHTNVPGPDGMLGFGGSCFPKDMAALSWEFYGDTFFTNILERNSEARKGCEILHTTPDLI
jgi:nucleotide sugar dehydrogenase